MTKFLKFSDEAQAKSVLSKYITEEGQWMQASHTHALDVVGVIQKPTGETATDEEGNHYPIYAPIPGFHVNYIGPEDFSQYEVTPSTPSRNFA